MVYAGDAFTVTPLTNDNATIASQLEALKPEIMPSAGSNTAQAVEKAVELFKQAGLQHGQVLLVTDSVNSEEVSAVVKKLENYQLSVLAVGTEEGAPISLPEGGFLKDESGSIVVPKLPASELQKLANDGHGIYQAISDNDSDIKNLLATVDKSVQKAGAAGDNNTKNTLLLEKWDEKGVWLLLLILPLAALNFRRGLLGLVFLCLIPVPKNSYALEWQDLWQTRDQQAYQAYKQGNFDKAAKLFEDPAWQAAAQYKSSELEIKQYKTPTTATGFYNQGNVFAKAGKYEEAIKAYLQALKQNPDKTLRDDALYNKKLVEDALKKQQQQQEQQKQSDKNQQDPKNQQKDNKDNQDKQGDKDKKDSQDNKDDKAEKTQQQSEQAENKKDNKSEQEKQQQEQQQQAAQAKKPESEKPQQKAQVQQAAQLQEDEKKQADEQWLNRIPDDPAGLLRRKFKYQYNQRQHDEEPAAQNW